MSRRRLTGAGYNAAAVLVLLVTLFPIYWMVATGFKRGIDILSFGQVAADPGDAGELPLGHRRTALLQDVQNSVLVVLATVLISLVLAFLAALAAARFRFRGRAALVVMLIVVQMVPLEALIIPIYLTLDRAGQTDRLAGIILTYLTFVLPFAIWTLRGVIVNIPKSSRRRRWSTAAPAPGRSGASCSRWSRPGWSRPRCSPSSWSGTTT